jgi:SAM-dependent methyltransferase
VPTSAVDTGALQRAYFRKYRVDIAHLINGKEKLRFGACPVCGLQSFDPAMPGDGDFYAQLSAWFDSHFPVDWTRDEIAAPPVQRKTLRQVPPALLQPPDPASRQEFELAHDYIQTGMSVLEVGCGKCYFWRSLQPGIRAGIRYVGLELDPAAVAAGNARQIDVRAELIEQHAVTAAEQYDVVCFFQVLEHIVEIRSFIDACLRCLKPGGYLIFSVPNGRSFLGFQPDNILNMPPHHVTWWTEMPIRYLASEARLRLETIAEDDLMPFNGRDFAKVLAMNYLRQLFRVQPRFELEGYAYMARRYAAAVASRLLARSMTGIGAAARGHSITAALQKPDM